MRTTQFFSYYKRFLTIRILQNPPPPNSVNGISGTLHSKISQGVCPGTRWARAWLRHGVLGNGA
jgi:hypothetical protein